MDIPLFLKTSGEAIGGLLTIWAFAKLVGKTLVKPFSSHLAKIDTIYRELTPNGGGSIKDAINRVQASVGRMEKRQRAWLTVHDKPVFETDSAGHCTWANRAYLHLLGATFEEIEGRGWRNYLAADGTFTEWAAAVGDKRDFKHCFKYRNGSGQEIPVCVEALAMKDEKGELLGYVGSVTRQG